MKLCDSCEYLKFCARSGIEDVGCDRYKRDATTNEEWFCSLPTEEKAKRIINIAVNSDCDYRVIVKWLKEIHHEV